MEMKALALNVHTPRVKMRMTRDGDIAETVAEFFPVYAAFSL